MRQRLSLMFLAALVPLISLAAGLAVYSLHQQQAFLRTEATYWAGNILDAAERELDGQVEVLRGLGTSISLDIPTPDLGRFHAQASRFVNPLTHWDVIILANLEGQQLVNTRMPYGAPLPRIVDEATFRRVIETRAPVIGDVSGPGPYAVDRIPRISIRVPIVRDGAVRFILTAVLSPERLSVITGHNIAPRWHSFLVDGSGRIAASAHRPENIGQRPSEQSLLARAAHQEGVYEGLTLDGIATVTAFRRSARTGWSAHVSIPRDLYNAPLRQVLWYLAASALAALALSLLFIEILRRETLKREKVSAHLRATEKRFQLLGRATQDAVWDWDFTANTIVWNEALLVLFGYAKNEVETASSWWEERIHPDDRNRILTSIQDTIDGQRSKWSQEYRFRRSDGTYADVLDRGYIMRDVEQNRRPMRMVGAMQDQTERKRIEKELQLRDRSLAAIGQGVVITDAQQPDNPMIYANAAFERLTGYSTEEILGRNCRFLQGSESDKAALLRIRAAIQLGLSVTETLVNYRKDGSAFVNQLAIAPVRDTNGKLTHLVGVQSDVTAFRQAQEALEHSQEELRGALEAKRAILDHSLDVICTIDENGAFSQVSPQALKVWGYLPHELVGRRYLELVHPEDQEKTIEIARKIIAGTPTTGFENRYIRRDGSTVPILWSAVWSDEHKTMFCVARDLSERLELEEQLRQSQKLQAVGQLTGGIAHDFNNLLTVILGNAEVLTEDPTDPALTHALAQQILETAERGADLNRKLLAFGRRQSLSPQRLRIGEVVDNIVPLLYRTLGEHIELRTEHEITELSAIVDRSSFESALLNLAVNARDAMPQGGTLTIKTGQRTAGFGEGGLPIGQDVVFVSVSDTGTGMPPEVLARVFEPFFTTKEVGKGSGLGLSMVFGFAQQSAGHVGIESEPGRGTTVTLILPGVASGGEKSLPDRAADTAALQSRVRVLVVEDEPAVLQSVSAMLISLGYEVAAVSKAQDALEVLGGSEPFDVLFTDVAMPGGISGVELARQAKEIRPSIRVLLTSGHAEEVFARHGERDRNTPLLHKPYRRRELATALSALLNAPVKPAA